MSSTKVYRSPETLSFTPFSFCSKRNETGPRVRVCFYQFLGSIFFFLNHFKKATMVLRNCNAARVWWCADGCRCVSKVRNHCRMYTWWIIAINVKYASAAKARSVSLSFTSLTLVFKYNSMVQSIMCLWLVSFTTFNDAHLLTTFHQSAHFEEHVIL